jgi:hypothetical protein
MMGINDCWTCGDKGFVRRGDEVTPCPQCNPDSGYEPGEYRRELIATRGMCGYARGGGGRTCPLEKGHKGQHIFQCALTHPG